MLLTVLAADAIWDSSKEILKEALKLKGAGFVEKIGDSLLSRTEEGSLPPNHNLDHALRHSLAKTARVLAYTIHDPDLSPLSKLIANVKLASFADRLAEMVQNNIIEKEPSDYWLAALIDESKKPDNFKDFSLDLLLTANQLTSLLHEQLDQRLRDHVQNEFLAWSNRHINIPNKPACFDNYVLDGWPLSGGSGRKITFYEVFCLFFREELKNNPLVFRALTVNTLAELKTDMTKMLAAAPSTEERARLEEAFRKLEDFAGFKEFLNSQDEKLFSFLRVEFDKVQGRFDSVDEKLDQLLEVKSSKAEPEEKIPDDIKVMFDEAEKSADAEHYLEAKLKYEEILKHPKIAALPLARIKAKIFIASILRDNNPDAARPLFRECLDELRTTPSERLREYVLVQFGDMESISGNLLEAKGLLIEAQEIANRLGGRLRIASILQSLAWLADSQGQLDEAIKLFDQAAELFMAEFQRHDAATEKQAMVGLGGCFNNKSITQKHKLDLVGSLSSLNEAIKWYRKSDSQHNLAVALYLLAEGKFADAKWSEGEKCLDESLQISMKQKDFIWASHCLDLRGRLKVSHGGEKQALDDFTAALSLMRENGKPKEVLDYLGKVAFITAKQGLKDEARKLFTEAKELSEKHELWDDYADAILDLSKLEEGKDANTNRKEALTIAIASLEKLLPKTQVKGRRAFLIGRIGSLYQQSGNLEEALNWFTRAKQLFEEIGDIAGVANCLGSFAEIMRKQNNPNEELKIYRQILNLAQGKPMPHLVAGTKINMGVCLMENGSFREAKQSFEEADEICRKYHLHEFEDSVRGNLERVSHWIEAHKPAAMDFSQLVRELHELVAFFPEAKDSILRFWYYVRDTELHSNCRSQSGLKLFVVEDDTKMFLHLAEKLAPYLDLALQAVNVEFPGWGIDAVPYPKDKAFPNRVAIAGVKKDMPIGGVEPQYVQFIHGALHWPYIVTSDEAKSKITGNIGCIIAGRAKGLPPQAHELMLGLKQEEIITKKVLFFPFERPADESRLLDDLRLAKEQTLIPFYNERLPESDEVEVLTSTELKFPIISSTATDKNRRQVAQTKRKLVRLLSLKDQEAVAMLTEIAGDLDDLMADSGAKESIRTIAYLLHFPVRGTMESHLALVHHSS